MAGAVGQDDDVPSSSSAAPSSSWWGAWGQGWIDTVKEKSAETIQMVKKDLNEFVEVIQGDTAVAISETASKIKPNDDGEDDKENDNESTINFDSIESATKVVKKGVANLLDSVSAFMAVPPDDSKEEVITIPDLSTPSHYDRKQEKIHAIQIDPGTYCNEPEGLFNDWLEVFNLDDNKQHMSSMLVQNPAVRSIYTQLVPAVVSHTTFWQRYFYRLFLIETEEKKREEIVARANNESYEGDDEIGSGWGDDDDDDDDDGIEVLSSLNVPNTATDMNFSIVPNTTMIEDNEESIDCKKNDETNSGTTALNDETKVMETPENSVANENIVVDSKDIKHEAHVDENLSEKQLTNLPDENTENSEHLPDKPESCDTISEACSVGKESDNGTIEPDTENSVRDEINLPSPVHPHIQLMSQENGNGETSSVGSWMSIDDTIKVKHIKGEQNAKCDTTVSSANVSTDSNGVIINTSDLIDESDEDFDLDVDDVNEFEVAKMVDEIKSMSAGGDLDDDDDWEKWE